MSIWMAWLLLSLIMLVVEAVTVGFFAITVAGGALAAMLVSFVIPVVAFQTAVFLVVSIVLYATVRPLLKRYFPLEAETKTAVDRLQGELGIVVETIDNVHGRGQVKCNGELWSARAAHGDIIEKGAKVRVLRVEGVKVVVEQIAEEA